jgi:hypothetical protein
MTVTTTIATRATTIHLRAVVVTVSKYLVATTTPMMGEHEDNNTIDKSYHDHDNSKTIE